MADKTYMLVPTPKFLRELAKLSEVEKDRVFHTLNILTETAALKTKNKREEDAVYELAGSWKDDRTVDEMIADIHSSRISNTRFLENLDD